MRRRVCPSITVTLSLLLAAAAPAHAGPVVFADIIQAVVVRPGGRADAELRLRSPDQGGRPSSADGDTVSVTQDDATTVETIDVGEVTGTICECGDILAPPDGAAGFPKWTLLAFAAVPLFFINGGGDGITGGKETGSRPPPVVTILNDPKITPPSTPTPTPVQPIPEPATLLLLGSSLLGLGAAKRRRRVSRNMDAVSAAMEEEL